MMGRSVTTALIAHIKLMNHSIAAIIKTIHPVYGAGKSSVFGRLYVQIHRMPPVTVLIAVRIIDVTGSSIAATPALDRSLTVLCDSRAH
jgi:hypothetical protein